MKYLSFLILLLISISVSGQANLLEKRGVNFIYKGQVYKCSELNEVYKDYQASLDLYLSGQGNKRAANIVAITGAPFILGGFIGLASGDLGGQILGAFSLVGGSLLELIALIPRGIGSRKINKARKIFNFEMIERHGYKSVTSLTFGISGNGVGFVYQF